MRASAPVRHLSLITGLLVGGLGLLAHAEAVEAGPGRAPGGMLHAPADTDSVAVDDALGFLRDTTSAESLLRRAALSDTTDADSARGDSLGRSRRYFPDGRHSYATGASLQPRRQSRLRGVLGPYWQRNVTLDSTAFQYAIRETVGGADVRVPVALSLDSFLVARRQTAVRDGFRDLAARRVSRNQRRGGLGITVDIPGGQGGAFETLFGKNEVDLRVNGTSTVDVGGSFDTNERQQAINPNSGGFSPLFGQELNLNVAGTIGDKLRINVNYDTQSQFDFENRVSLVYTGYEDDIIQRIEAGNVFLQTPSELIRGGQRLFGLRTDLQFGPLAVTAVASQQDAQSNEVVIEGGSQATPINLDPFTYEDNTHFFVGYAFHNWWDAAHETPGLRTLHPGLQRIEAIEVWKHDQSLLSANDTPDETTWAIALADLAEPRAVLNGGEEYLGLYDPATGYANEIADLPDPSLDAYSEADLTALRDNVDAMAAGSVEEAVGPSGIANTRFRKLEEGTDYSFDAQLGWISLTTALAENEILAVAYRYRSTGDQIITVGDFGDATRENSQNGPRIVLKLLRDDIPTPTDPLWDLTMRNIYRVGGRSLNAGSFAFDVVYEPPGRSEQPYLPGVEFGEALSLLTILGLDRVNGQGQAIPDDAFDFTPGVTIDPAGGRVIFPMRQPFGDFLERLIRDGLTTGQARTLSGESIAVNSPSGDSPDAAVDEYAFPILYDDVQGRVRRQPGKLTRYSLVGESKSATQSIFNAGFNLVEGSVRVTADDKPLTEDVDYRVNYSSGTIEIVNPLFLQGNQQIRVESEQQNIVSFGGKTLLGLRADYDLGDDVALGATYMQLNERPLQAKFRVGEEALSNGILGFDGRYEAEPLWITRALDALPLIQTRADSRISIRGEYARLLPGHPQTLAFRDAQRTLAQANASAGVGAYMLAEDELNGASYIDDFEGSETAYRDLEEPLGWRLAAVPDSAGPIGKISPASVPASADVTDPRLATNWRGLFTWYIIPNETLYRETYPSVGQETNRATRYIRERQLIPRDYRDREGERPIGSLDLYFDPTRRGPYNYNGDLAGTLRADPRTAWGGMTQPIRNSYSDFGGQNNIEFIEVLMAPLGGRDGTEAVQPGAEMYIDLGRINEDILPNSRLNSEDGLSDATLQSPPVSDEVDAWGRLPTRTTNGTADFREETGRTEDVGLDGLPSRTDLVAPGGEPYGWSEQQQFAPFVDAVSDPVERARADRDPSADDFHHYLDQSYFGNPALFEGGQPTLQERYAHFYPATELNTAVAQREIEQESEQSGIALGINTEDVNANSSLDQTERYHRYRIPLDDAGLRASPFFQNTVEGDGSLEETWYLLRIPIRTDASARTTSPGLDRNDFSRIESVRLWTTGHDRPATIRLKSFELVGSQWLKSELVGVPEASDDAPPAGPEPSLFIESINNEESASVYAPPRGTVFQTSASLTGGNVALREQSIVFRAEALADGREAGIVRSYATRPLDLTKYSNLRAYVHGHGYEVSDSVRVFVRLGDDETENYYEYSQPVYPFDPGSALGDSPTARADSLWQTAVRVGGETIDRNSINIVLSELNQLKVARDKAGASLERPYVQAETPDGAPRGARIAIVGEPSIQDVETIVLGIRNAEGGQVVIDTVTTWFNELRVTGYDEAPGASGFLAANFQLADVANVVARYTFTDDGFGGLSSGLGDREFAASGGFSLTSTLNAHKLLPERFGWSIPVGISYTTNESTPRFDPDRGDIRVSELVEQELEDEDNPDREIDAEAIRERTQTVSRSRSIRIPISKRNSRSPVLQYTLDKLNLSYSASAREGRTPINASNTADSWQANAGYNLTIQKPKTVTPFWLLRPVPVVGSVIGGLQLNVLPRQLTLSASANRAVSSTEPRLRSVFESEPDSISAFRVRARRNQSLDHARRMDIGYSPFSFLQLGYGSSVTQDFGALGQDESFSILVRDTTTAGTFSREFAVSPTDARQTDGEVYQALVGAGVINDGDPFPSNKVEILGGSELLVRPFDSVVARLFRGGDVRTERYDQTASANLTLSTAKVKWLSWVRPQPISYQSSYSWSDQPLAGFDDIDIASVGTRAQIQSGVQLQVRELFRLFPFYRAWETEERASGQRADSSRGLDLGALARKTALAVTGFNDLSMTYRGSLTSSANGVSGDGFSLISGVQGRAPSLGYRLGLDRTLPLDLRLANDAVGLRQEDVLGDQHDLEARASLQPFSSLRVNLSWRTGWSTNDQIQYDVADGTVTARPAILSGNGESSVLAIGGSYESLLARHRDRFLDDLAQGETDEGYLVSETLTRTGLADDFLREFGRGFGRFGPNGLLTVPMPTWDVTYTGLSKWPLLNRLAQQVSVRHGYFASSRSAFGSNFLTAGERISQAQRRTLPTPDGSRTSIIAPASVLDADAIDPETMTLNERFQPLIGLQIGWKGGFQTDINWSRSNLYTLSTSASRLVQKNISEIQLQASYAKTGLKLFGLRRLNNNLRLTLSASVGDDETVNRPLALDLAADITGVDREAPALIRTRRLSFWPRISYSISNQVTADLFLRYERLDPEGGSNDGNGTSSLDSGISFRISFSN